MPNTSMNHTDSTGGTTGRGDSLSTLNGGSGGGGNSTANASDNGGDGELLHASMQHTCSASTLYGSPETARTPGIALLRAVTTRGDGRSCPPV